jgi:hypothetical protein
MIKRKMETEEKRKEMDNIMTILLKDLLEDQKIQARIKNFYLASISCPRI